MGNIDYTSTTTPPNYKCGKCGASGVKLWRPYSSSHVELLCASCAATDQHIDISQMKWDGTHYAPRWGNRTDQLGWYVPAVPDEEGVSYWGYTSVPDAGVKWWRQLPNRV